MQILNLFNGRNVIIYGVGDVGKSFWNKFKEKIEIYACTCSEEEFEPLQGLKGVERIKLSKENDYLIICSTYYEEIRRELMIYGLEPGTDFIKWEYFEYLWDAETYSKKVVVTIGQCEISEMCYGLKNIKKINELFSIFWFDETKVCIHGNKYCLEDFIDCKFFCQIADVFIFPTVFSQKSFQGFSLMKTCLKVDAKTICVSIFDYDGYWPQDIDRGRHLSKYYMVQQDAKLAAYCARDQIVEKMVDEGMKASDILKQVCRKDYLDYDTVIENHQKCIKRAKLTDRTADVKISDFVENKYNTIKLYCDRGHFNQNLLKEYVLRLGNVLGVMVCVEDVEQIDFDVLYENVNEFPIYPSAAEYLNLECIYEETKYRMVNYHGIFQVNFEEYMDKLIQYYINAKKLLTLC